LAKKKKYKIKKEEREPEKKSTPYSRFAEQYNQRPKKKRTPEQIKEYKKIGLLLAGWAVVSASAYIVCVRLEFYPILPIYTFGGAALFFVWLIFNGGFKKIDLEKIEKPEEMGYDEFCKFTDKIKERQKKAKYFLVFFLPLFVIMLVDWYINLRKL
jgi:hypothetical protein